MALGRMCPGVVAGCRRDILNNGYGVSDMTPGFLAISVLCVAMGCYIFILQLRLRVNLVLLIDAREVIRRFKNRCDMQDTRFQAIKKRVERQEKLLEDMDKRCQTASKSMDELGEQIRALERRVYSCDPRWLRSFTCGLLRRPWTANEVDKLRRGYTQALPGK